MNGGILIVKDAGRPMIDAGLFDSIKKFRTQAYTIIGEMDCWERVDRGKYRFTQDADGGEPEDDVIQTGTAFPPHPRGG